MFPSHSPSKPLEEWTDPLNFPVFIRMMFLLDHVSLLVIVAMSGAFRGTWWVTCPTCIFIRQKVSRWFSNHRRVFLWILNHQQKVMNVVILGRSNVSCVVHKQLFIHCFTLRGLILPWPGMILPTGKSYVEKNMFHSAVGKSLACIWANNGVICMLELWTPGFLDVEIRGNSY